MTGLVHRLGCVGLGVSKIFQVEDHCTKKWHELRFVHVGCDALRCGAAPRGTATQRTASGVNEPLQHN